MTDTMGYAGAWDVMGVEKPSAHTSSVRGCAPSGFNFEGRAKYARGR